MIDLSHILSFALGAGSALSIEFAWKRITTKTTTKSTTTLSNNSAGGHIAGGNINVSDSHKDTKG